MSLTELEIEALWNAKDLMINVWNVSMRGVLEVGVRYKHEGKR